MKLSCMRVIDVFDPQACETRTMRVSWQVYCKSAQHLFSLHKFNTFKSGIQVKGIMEPFLVDLIVSALAGVTVLCS